MLIFLIILFALPMVLGIAAFSALKLFQEKVALSLTGALTGLAAFVTLTYLVSLVVPLTPILLIIFSAGMVVAIVLLFFNTDAWSHWWAQPLDYMAIGVLVATILLFSIIAPKLLIEKPEGLYTGIVNAYGDIAWHLSNVTTFAAGQSVPPENPIFAGTRLTYPFLSNFFSAMLLVTGASFAQSVDLPALVLIPLFLTLVYILVRDLGTETTFSWRARQLAGVIALLLFLFGGATFGWVRFYSDWQTSGSTLLTFLTHLPARDYSGVGTDSNGFHFLNPVTSLLLPQRSFLFGLPLAIAVVLLLLQGRKDNTHPYLAAGVVAGMLPLFHAHTVLALVPIIIALFLLRPTTHWIFFILTAGIVGVPELFYFAGERAVSGSFMRWGPRWMAGDENLAWYWFKNTGFLIPMSLAGLFLPLPRRIKLLTAAAASIFIVANLYLFAPWAWDNFKLFVYWFLFSLPLVSYLATRFLLGRTMWALKALVVAVIGIHLLSAALDITKLALPTAATWGEWDTEGIAMAAKIKATTKPGESILNAPIHNSVAVLAGRPMYLGYAAHVWSHGGLPWDREKAIKPFYEGASATLPEVHPTYVLVGPVERAQYPGLTIRPEWQLTAQVGSYALYRLP